MTRPSRYLLLACLTLLLSPLSAWSQTASSTLQGTVLSDEGDPLPNVTVLLNDHQAGTATDLDGHFQLTNLQPGTYEVTFSMVGYQSRSQQVTLQTGNTRVLEVHLEPEHYLLGSDVVVTATRTEQSVATAPASISVVSSQALEQSSVGDLSDALRSMPGVSISAGSQGRRSLQLRGMEASHTLLLVDGRRINSSEAVFRHNDYDIGMLPLEAIDRIEVVRGGMSALYGSEALGGVINIITKPVSDSWSAKVSTEFQSPVDGEGGEELRTSVYTSGSIVPDRVGLTLTGTFNRRNIWHGWGDEPLLGSDGAPVLRPDGSAVNRQDLATLEGRDDHNVRGKLTFTPWSNQKIEAEYGRGLQSRRGEYFISGWGEADTRIDRQDVVITHQSTFSWGESEIRGYGEWIDTNSDRLRQSNTVIEGNVSAEAGRHGLTAGGEVQWLNLNAPEAFTSGKASVYQQAFYLQDEYALTDRFKLLAGARLDNHENFGLHLTPRGYLVYSLTDQLVLKGGVGTAFRAPTLRQLSGESRTVSCRGGCLIVGDPNLDPETSVNYEISANWRSSRLGGSVTAFLNEVDNLIDTPRGEGVPTVGVDPETGLDIYVPRNVNRARIRGLEMTLFTNIGRIGRFTANYVRLDARDLSADEPLQNRPKHDLNGEFSWFASQDIKLFLRGKYIGEQITSAGQLDPYALFDVGGSWRVSDSLRFRAGVLNLANRRTDDPGDSYSFVERGRSVYFGISADL